MKRSVLGLVAMTLMFAACGGGSDGDSDSKDTGETKSAQAGKDEANSCGGSEKCKLPAAFKDRETCCMDPFSGGGCGIKMGATCRPLPKVDERCPTPELNVMIPGMGNIIDSTFGCCTSSNECGVDFGAGCQPRTIACMVVNAEQVDKIKPQTCDGKELPLPAMCGAGPGFMLPMFPGAAGSGS